MSPGQTECRLFLNQYEEAVKRPFGYLLIDLKTNTQDNCRLRTNVLPSEGGMLLKRGTGNGERGTGNGERGAGSGERGTEVWERVVSGNLHKNPKWRSKKRERERRRQRKEFVPWLKSGGDEIANQTHFRSPFPPPRSPLPVPRSAF